MSARKFERGDSRNGYSVGFFSFVEHLLYIAATKIDHYAFAEVQAQYYAAATAAREKEEGGNHG